MEVGLLFGVALQQAMALLPQNGGVMRHRILLVDDDPLIRRALELRLVGAGYQVLTAGNGREALARLEQEPVDLVLSDIRMPDMDGLELLRWVKMAYPGVGVILLTAYSSLDSAIQALRHGADDYLLKPCAGEELLEQIQAVIARHDISDRLSGVEEDLPAIASLVRAVEARDPYTRGHSERVAHYAALLGGELGLSMDEIERLWLAGLLHDIGKIGVPDAILHKPGPLTEEEYRRVKQHCQVAVQILSPISGLRHVIPFVLSHHERVDGKGYPNGLAGEAIPLSARILAVADGFEAMTSHRAYRQAYSTERALEILEEGAGTQWDADLVARWVALVREGRLTQPESLANSAQASVSPAG